MPLGGPEDDEGADGQLDDYLDEHLSADDAYHEIAFANLEWWDSVAWERIPLTRAPTTAMVPDSMAAAVSHIKARACLTLEHARAGWEGMPPVTTERLWKMFLALGGLLSSEGPNRVATGRRESLQERLRWIIGGRWDAAWLSMEDQTRRGPAGRGREDKIGARVRRVTELARAGELSRAAAAVWPQGDMADAAAVARKFATTQQPPRHLTAGGPNQVLGSPRACLVGVAPQGRPTWTCAPWPPRLPDGPLRRSKVQSSSEVGSRPT